MNSFPRFQSTVFDVRELPGRQFVQFHGQLKRQTGAEVVRPSQKPTEQDFLQGTAPQLFYTQTADYLVLNTSNPSVDALGQRLGRAWQTPYYALEGQRVSPQTFAVGVETLPFEKQALSAKEKTLTELALGTPADRLQVGRKLKQSVQAVLHGLKQGCRIWWEKPSD
ncbi:MAG: hypothetical protein SFZ03_04170 [Candidatus Melainabacteria bacterium]|nr:hypothetical protein [Candidatus Melainabacteria bacterium]